jgi:putative colanic acid biosynthesis acetyltransferase WcaF
MTDNYVTSKVRLKDFDRTAGLNRVNRFTEVSWYLVKMCFFLTAIPFPNKIKLFFLKQYKAKVGKRITIKPRVNIHMPWNLQIGDDVWIGEEVLILNVQFTTIGSNVCISQRAFLCAGNHDYRDPAMANRYGPINLMDGVWVGAGSIIGPGVTIATDTVVTAGSVVTENLSENAVYKGNPAVYQNQRWK